MISIQNIVFFSVLLILYYSVPKTWQKHVLLAVDILFALSFGIPTLVMLIVITFVVFFGVRGMSGSSNKEPGVVALVVTEGVEPGFSPVEHGEVYASDVDGLTLAHALTVEGAETVAGLKAEEIHSPGIDVGQFQYEFR